MPFGRKCEDRMKTIYLNHAATSNRRPGEVIDKVCRYLQENNAVSPNRSFFHSPDMDFMVQARERVATFFHASNPDKVIFTSGATMALNMVLYGLLKPGDHVIATSVEHNAVARPLHFLEKHRGIDVTFLACEKDGSLNPQNLLPAITSKSKVLVMTHASNVLGTILPVSDCFQVARKLGLTTVLDTAQTAGFLPINMEKMNADVLIFTGHKGLLGLSGTGGFLLNEGIEEKISVTLTGGTGSRSLSLEQPGFLPDKYEAGTPNATGIISLDCGIGWLLEQGVESLQRREQELIRQFLEEAGKLPLKILGACQAENSVPLVSVLPLSIPPEMLSERLYQEFGIITRCGLHCAPLAHQTAGTLDTGAVRFSFGWNTESEEVIAAVRALYEILR